MKNNIFNKKFLHLKKKNDENHLNSLISIARTHKFLITFKLFKIINGR